MNYKTLTVILTLMLCSACNTVVSPAWEIADPQFKHIAEVRPDPDFSFMVIYNPDYCKKIGEGCGFFRLHAYAHYKLNHNLFPEPKYYSNFDQNQADCYAAKNGNPIEVTAAARFLADASLHNGVPIHGDPAERATLIEKCAKENNRWLE
jgi:hypothetical protein